MPAHPESSTLRDAGFRGAFRADTLARALYAEGAGIARALPSAVAVPVDPEDVSALVRWGRREGYALIPRGSGSGMAAGAVGSDVMVDVSRFTAIGTVDRERRRVRVGAGAVRGAVDRAAREHGLRFPVDPSSGAFCTVGGMAATNAAGARTFRHGATRAWVHGVRAIFDDGSDVWVRRGEPAPTGVPAIARIATTLRAVRDHGGATAALRHRVIKESSGYAIETVLSRAAGVPWTLDGDALVDLLVGSEGTLAIFVELELRLAPVAHATATVLASFPTLEAATACAVAMRESVPESSACEMLDRTFLDVAESRASTGVPTDAEAVLLIEVEGADAGAARAAAEAVAARCQAGGASETRLGLDAETEHRLWALRHAASPILASLAPRLRSMQFIEDGCVPPEHFPAYVRGVREALRRFETTGVIFGHAGDAHAHVNPLLDVSYPAWRDRVRGILGEVSALTARLGGTLAGEHGDGRLRAPILPTVWPTEALAAFANLKAAADPARVLNPGCKIPRPGDDPLASLRHDPAAPPLDPRARATLDEIERTRAWNRFRLEGSFSGTEGETHPRSPHVG